MRGGGGGLKSVPDSKSQGPWHHGPGWEWGREVKTMDRWGGGGGV